MHFRQAGRSTRFAGTVLALLLALVGPVQGHAFWPSNHSARTGVSMSAEGLQAAVVIEVPAIRLIEGFKEHFEDLDLMAEIEAGRFAALEEEYNRVLFATFAEGLDLFVDDRPAVGAWQPVDTPVNGRGTEGFFVYLLEFAFDEEVQPAERLRVRLVNRTLEGFEVVMANQATAADGWRVVESSIPPPTTPVEIPRGAAVEEELALWSIDPVKRDLRVVFSRQRDD